MKVENTPLTGLKVISPIRHADARGFFSETFNAQILAEHGIDVNFVQDNHSLSAEPGTVRGLHFQSPPWDQVKLVRVTKGAILDVAVDIRETSPTYGRHFAVELSATNWLQLFVPRGFAHGFCTLMANTEVIYKVSNFYTPGFEGGVLWNDSTLNIPWPGIAGAMVSDKDAKLPTFAELSSPFG